MTDWGSHSHTSNLLYWVLVKLCGKGKAMKTKEVSFKGIFHGSFLYFFPFHHSKGKKVWLIIRQFEISLNVHKKPTFLVSFIIPTIFSASFINSCQLFIYFLLAECLSPTITHPSLKINWHLALLKQSQIKKSRRIAIKSHFHLEEF